MTNAKSFTAVGAGPAAGLKDGDKMDWSVSGTFVGTVVYEKSEDGGQTWVTKQTLTAPSSGSHIGVSRNGSGALHRFNCVAFTSGTIVTSNKNDVVGAPFGLDCSANPLCSNSYGDSVAPTNGEIKLLNGAVLITGSGVPTDGTSGTGKGFAGPGSLYIDFTNAQAYLNGNTAASPTWKKLTRAA